MLSPARYHASSSRRVVFFRQLEAARRGAARLRSALWLAAAVAAAAMLLAPAVSPAQQTAPTAGPKPAAPLQKVTFATNWKAQAAHGGFYQAVADGTYARYGLEVTIRQGGPQVNNRPLLPVGKIDFLMTGNLLHSFDNVKNGLPVVAVSAIFQKDPQALIAHPGQGYEDFARLKTAPVVLVAKDAQFSWWQWLKVQHGFRDEQLRPYNFNLGPFLANPRSVQQGYSVAEPIYVENQARFKPVVHLLADHGYSTYSTLIETRTELVQKNPALVQRFVDASAIGWYNYLYGDRRLANAAMRRDNPEMTDDEIERSVALLRAQGIADSGEALTRGIGAMDPARVRDFYDKMVRAGLYKPGDVDLARVIDARFVNKGVGLELRKRLLPK